MIIPTINFKEDGVFKVYDIYSRLLNDRIIFLTSQAMFLFGRYARKYYKNRYLYDFRDETYEKYEMYRRTILKCILSSYKTVVSSNGFLELFPEIPQEKFDFIIIFVFKAALFISSYLHILWIIGGFFRPISYLILLKWIKKATFFPSGLF